MASCLRSTCEVLKADDLFYIPGRKKLSVLDMARTPRFVHYVYFFEESKSDGAFMSIDILKSTLVRTLVHYPDFYGSIELCDDGLFHIANFLSDWASMARTGKVLHGSSDVPVLKGDPKASTYQPNEYKVFDVPFKAPILRGMQSERFQVNCEYLDATKVEFQSEEPKAYKLSKNDVLCAVLWKAIAKTMQLGDDDDASLIVPINARMAFGLPQNYNRNCVCQLYIKVRYQYLKEMSLAQVSRTIREKLQETRRNSHFTVALNWLEKGVSDGHAKLLCPNLSPAYVLIASQVHLPHLSLDFGYGRPVSFSPLQRHRSIYVVASPVSNIYSVFACLEEHCMKTLVEDEDFRKMLVH